MTDLKTRLAKRNRRELCGLPPDVHVRAELDRLERQVRKMNRGSGAVGYYAARQEVLDLIREAKQ